MVVHYYLILVKEQGTRQLQPSLRTNNPDARSLCVCVRARICRLFLQIIYTLLGIYTFIMNSFLIYSGSSEREAQSHTDLKTTAVEVIPFILYR
jgi:hypothetical protein